MTIVLPSAKDREAHVGPRWHKPQKMIRSLACPSPITWPLPLPQPLSGGQWKGE